MMSDSTMVDILWGPTAYLASLILASTPFILYYTQSSIMYTIAPTGCDSTLFVNESSWYTGSWVIIPAYGVCPEDTYSYTAMYGYTYQGGYRTFLYDGAKVWAKADELLIVSTVFLLLIPLGIIGLSGGEDDDQLLIILTLLLAVPIALYLVVDVFISVQETDQIQPEAWALEMFRSCNVTVTTEYGFYLVMYVIAVCGVLVVMSYGLIGYSCFKQCRSRLAARQAAADERSNVDDSSNNISYTGTLVSRSWAYGRTQRESALNSNSRIRNGDESTSLLDNEVGGASGRLKTKNDARIYQTATEYGNDTTEYYQLPSAPATSATTE